MAKRRIKPARSASAQPGDGEDSLPSTKEQLVAPENSQRGATRDFETRHSPSSLTKAAISLGILFHFTALYVAFNSNFFQSRLQEKIMDALSPYLISTSQAYGATPLELTHAQTFDFPIRVEVRLENESAWRPLNLGNPRKLLSQVARWNHFTRVVGIILEDDPESEILAEIALNLVNCSSTTRTSSGDSIVAIRVIQPHVLSFDEATAKAAGQEDLIDLSPKVRFEAAVVRRNEQVVGLVPSQERYRSSKSILPNSMDRDRASRDKNP